MKDLSGVIQLIKQAQPNVLKQVGIRATRASHALRNAELDVLRGTRAGRLYNKPGTGRVKYYKRTMTAKVTYKKYTASAPGEPPAVRTNALRSSFRPISRPMNRGFLAALETNNHYAGYLDEGTRKMAARPFSNRILEKAKPEIDKIFNEPYNL